MILNLFFRQLMRLFRKDFQINVLHSIQKPSFTKEFERMFIWVSVKRGAGVGVIFFSFFFFFQHHRSFVGQIRIKANIKKLSL